MLKECGVGGQAIPRAMGMEWVERHAKTVKKVVILFGLIAV